MKPVTKKSPSIKLKMPPRWTFIGNCPAYAYSYSMEETW